MALYVYNIATGALFSWSPNDTDPVSDPATLAMNGLAMVKGLPPLDAAHAWDSTQLTIVAVVPVTPPPPPVINGTVTVNGVSYPIRSS